jgi:hypothetical protein
MSNWVQGVVARLATVALPVLALVHLGIANATLITFDDLPPPLPGDFAKNPVTNQYASKGLLISGGYLTQPDPASKNQALLASEFAQLIFLDTLPTFVSLSVSSSLRDHIYVSASGPSFLQTITTSGYGGPLNSTPYMPNELVSFASPGGISFLRLSDFYNFGVDAIVDNVYFGAVPAVPEPPSWVLMGVGLLLFIAVKRKRSG